MVNKFGINEDLIDEFEDGFEPVEVEVENPIIKKMNKRVKEVYVAS